MLCRLWVVFVLGPGVTTGILVNVLLYKGRLVIRNSEPVVANQGSGYGHRGARLYTTVHVYVQPHAMRYVGANLSHSPSGSIP